MKAEEPGSTGTLKSAMITSFPEVCGTGAEAWAKRRPPIASTNIATQSKLKRMRMPKIFGRVFDNFYPSLGGCQLPIRFGLDLPSRSEKLSAFAT